MPNTEPVCLWDVAQVGEVQWFCKSGSWKVQSSLEISGHNTKGESPWTRLTLKKFPPQCVGHWLMASSPGTCSLCIFYMHFNDTKLDHSSCYNLWQIKIPQLVVSPKWSPHNFWLILQLKWAVKGEISGTSETIIKTQETVWRRPQMASFRCVLLSGDREEWCTVCRESLRGGLIHHVRIYCSFRLLNQTSLLLALHTR